MGYTIRKPSYIIQTGGGAEPLTPEKVYENRPSHWITMPETNFNEVYMLVPIYETSQNLFAINVTSSTNYNVDIIDRDGSVISTFVGQSSVFETEIDWANVNGLATNGEKQVLIKVYGATITNVDFNQSHSLITTNWQSPILEIKANYNGNFTVTDMRGLKYFDFLGSCIETAMENKFIDCYSLTTILNLDTSSVTSMSYMFNRCYSLQTIPLLDTSSVTNMYYMFRNCYSLQTIPLLDTSSVTDMSRMFYYCYSLQTIPLLDTSSVTDMNNMFYYCYSLQTIPLLDTSSVTSMSYMFNRCHSLQTIPLLDTSSATSIGDFITQAYSLQNIHNIDFSSATSVNDMFEYAESLINITITPNSTFGPQTANSFTYVLADIGGYKIPLEVIDKIADDVGAYTGGGTRTIQITGSLAASQMTQTVVDKFTAKGYTLSY